MSKYIGGELTVATEHSTFVALYNDPECESVTLADVEVGASVSVSGIVVADAEGNDVFPAKRITVGVPLQVLE